MIKPHNNLHKIFTNRPPFRKTMEISTALFILLYSGVSTYVGLYGSGLFNFRSYVNLPTLFACFLGFDVPTSFAIFIKNVFIILVYIL